MNIVILDDDSYKREVIKNDLDFLGESTFQEFSSMHSGVYYLAKNVDKVDLLVLDWVFPSFDDGFPEANMGLEVLSQLYRVRLPIPVIVCSSEEVNIPKKISGNVIGTVAFDGMTDMKPTFQKILKEHPIVGEKSPYEKR